MPLSHPLGESADRDTLRPRRPNCMKQVIAIIRPNRLDAVKAALKENGVKGLSISEVKGQGRHGKENAGDLVPKNRLEIALADDQVDSVVETILQSAATGDTGDGKIFIVPLENAFRVRTGETGDDAL